MSADAEFSSSAARAGGVGEWSGGGGDGGGSRGEGGVTLSLSDLVSSRPR